MVPQVAVAVAVPAAGGNQLPLDFMLGASPHIAIKQSVELFEAITGKPSHRRRIQFHAALCIPWAIPHTGVTGGMGATLRPVANPRLRDGEQVQDRRRVLEGRHGAGLPSRTEPLSRALNALSLCYAESL